VILAVYVNDILLTGSDLAGLVETRKYLRRHFVTKDMGKLKYFLGIKVAHKNIVYFLNRNVLWIFWKRQNFWSANILVLQ